MDFEKILWEAINDERLKKEINKSVSFVDRFIDKVDEQFEAKDE